MMIGNLKKIFLIKITVLGLKRSLPDANGWEACSVLIMAGEYIRLSPKKVRRTTTEERLCRFISWQECQTGYKQEARSPRVAQDTETNSGVQGLETGCRFSSIYWPPCKLLFKSAVVQTKRPALLGSAKRALKNSDSHLAELVMRPQADQIGAIEIQI